MDTLEPLMLADLAKDPDSDFGEMVEWINGKGFVLFSALGSSRVHNQPTIWSYTP